jgi:predicted dehydrogenase
MAPSRAPAGFTPSIGFVGLATSHPYTDAGTIVERHPHATLHVCEPDGERLADFIERHPGATVHGSPGSLAEAGVDGVIITTRPPEVAAAISALVDVGSPLFINKPAAATLDQLESVDAVVRPIANRVLSASVLRFAAPVRELVARLDRAEVLTASAVVRHDVGRWLSGSTDWQDDLRTGGGSIVTIGMHGLELLVCLLGTDFEVVSSMAQVRRLTGLRSEDAAVIGLQWADGILGSIHVVGVAPSESYGVTFETASGPVSIALPAGDADPFGYRGAIDGFLGMVEAACAGRPVVSPVPWDQTHAILRGIATASGLAHPTVG